MHDKVGAEAHQSFHFWSTGSTPNAGQCEEVLRRRRGGEALNSRRQSWRREAACAAPTPLIGRDENLAKGVWH